MTKDIYSDWFFSSEEWAIHAKYSRASTPNRPSFAKKNSLKILVAEEQATMQYMLLVEKPMPKESHDTDGMPVLKVDNLS